MRSSSRSSGYCYDTTFLEYSSRVSARSAKQITRLLIDVLSIQSVLDVGCAQATWLSIWQQLGIKDFVGVDGDYVDRDRLEISLDHFIPQDVSKPFHLQRRFDLVQCLEVAEHIPAEQAATLIDNLTRHGACILFSAAPPGQGGEYHVNEQTYEYWRDLFRARDFIALDAVRPAIHGDSTVAVWYRHNIILYVHRDLLERLSDALKDSVIPEGVAIPDVSPLLYRFRKMIVRRIPFSVQQVLAKFAARTRG